MNIRIVNQSSHALPEYETLSSAGMDLRAQTDTPITLEPMERGLLKPGFLLNFQ